MGKALLPSKRYVFSYESGKGSTREEFMSSVLFSTPKDMCTANRCSSSKNDHELWAAMKKEMKSGENFT